MIQTYFLIPLLLFGQFNIDPIVSQRTFINPAVTDPAPCACDITISVCDSNCCCDSDCTDPDLAVSSVCNGVRTTSSYSSSQEMNLRTWNCSNSTSSAAYDYFPFVCVQLTLNEVIGQFYPTDNVTFVTSRDTASRIRPSFTSNYRNLFQKDILSSTYTLNYTIGSPILLSAGTTFKLPGDSIGSNCQTNVDVLFGINRDISCKTSSIPGFCTSLFNITSFIKGDGTATSVGISFFSKTYNLTATPPRNSGTEYYFQDSYAFSINNFTPTPIDIPDYCDGRHPYTRTQRYRSACGRPDISLCSNLYQTWSNCRSRENFRYDTINDSYFTARDTSLDDSLNLQDFAASRRATSFTCSSNTIRLFYRFNYSSIDNTITSVEVFALENGSTRTFSPRITIQWNDVANITAATTTIPRSYSYGETLQFRRNNNASDISAFVPTSNGLCVDATREIVHYKQSRSSSCFIQLKQSTIEQCHNLKLNMYLYLNVFFAPASDVLAYPSPGASLIKIRDNVQDSLDLDRIDEVRPNNLLNTTYISRTRLLTSTYKIYDATQTLPICYDVPSGVYIQFGYVRVRISPTVSYERIVSVQYNYVYSTWQFDCTQGTCDDSVTKRFPVSFQVEFFDYTNKLLNFSETTKSDITSADNYVEHLLWLISPEYKGEPGYRNYTNAMILIFIAISIVVLHVQLFGIMCPL